MNKDEFIKILEEMPTGKTLKMKVGENEYACESLNTTVEEIQKYNLHTEGWNEGFESAVEKYKEWRNEQYLKLKNII